MAYSVDIERRQRDNTLSPPLPAPDVGKKEMNKIQHQKVTQSGSPWAGSTLCPRIKTVYPNHNISHIHAIGKVL